MHVLYVHKNFPAQFGHLAEYLIEHEGFQCTFVSQRPPRASGRIRQIQYKVCGGAHAKTHYCSRSLENFTWHSHAVYETMKAHREVKPDLVVGHSGFGSTLFLAELYDCPIINFCEWYYGPGGETDFRSEFPADELNPLRGRMRNAALLADLECCTAGYSPTNWQRSRLPRPYHHKVETIFDGVDTDLWRRRVAPPGAARRIGDREIPPGTPVVTYVSRGFESMRGFDIFMQIAKRICQQRADVVFVCVGTDECRYGADGEFTGGRSFRKYVLEQDEFDLDRFLFTGRVPTRELAGILSLSDLHVYLTVPFVLSWSVINALACGCTVLASDTEPVREVIHHGVNGLLAPFYDVEGFVALALQVLDDPQAYGSLGEAAVEMIHRRYSLRAIAPKMLDLYQRTVSGSSPGGDSPTEVAEAGSTVCDSRADGLQGLARQHPWPAQKPGLACCEADGLVRPAHRKMLADVLGGDTEVVVETGAWIGLTTRLIAQQAPGARVIAVDPWKRPPGPHAMVDFKAMTPEVYERFLVNCWADRDRVIPLPGSTAGGLKEVHARGISPDVVYMSANGSAAVASDVRLARELFPDAVLLGNHWHWPPLQRALGAVVQNGCGELQVMGDMWSIRRGGVDG